MPIERMVINTGPLITLALIEAIDIPGKLPYQFVCPREVRAELDQGEGLGYRRISPEWLHVIPLERPVSALAISSLDLGEAAVIELALEQSVSWVCIDEWKGRRAAIAAGLKVAGVLGLLGKAKQLGIIKSMRPMVERAITEGIRYHPALVEKVLSAVGE